MRSHPGLLLLGLAALPALLTAGRAQDSRPASGPAPVTSALPPGRIRVTPPPVLPEGLVPGERPGEYVWQRDGSVMVYVPPGPFLMGAPADYAYEDPWNKPQHKETIARGYFIDRDEVTNARYRAFLEALATDGHKTCPKDEPEAKDHRPLEWGSALYAKVSPGPSCPVSGVDWHDATAFATWAQKRLPAEPEWEKAARGTDGRIFPWGNDQPEQPGERPGRSSAFRDGKKRANWWGELDGFKFLSPVGSFPDGASPYGCLDMAGNAWEWTSSHWTNYPGTTGTFTEEFCRRNRVYKGGAFNYTSMDMQSTHRHPPIGYGPAHREHGLGFRCALDSVEPAPKKG